jgi:cation diffusion facilitator family transporter
MIAVRPGLTRYARLGLLVNAVLAVVKGVAGVVGNSYALIADAVESSADILSSVIVWNGLRIAARDPDEEFQFGYGKAEALSAAIVSLFLLAAAVGISVEAVREIRTPHHAPAPFTLAVLLGVVFTKEVLFRRVAAAGERSASVALTADAWHHRSDAITSFAAFVGISVALIGGKGWEPADDWAALAASIVIFVTAVRTLRPAIAELMDRSPAPEVRKAIEAAVTALPDVRGVHRVKVRRAGGTFFVDLHVQADRAMSLHDAHIVSGKAKSAIRAALPGPTMVLVHMEPEEEADVARGPAA